MNYVPMRVAPVFTEVFAGSGLTPFVAEHPSVFLLVPVACTVAYLLYWFNVRHMVLVQVVCLILSLLVIPLTIILMYLPIFRLGNAIVE